MSTATPKKLYIKTWGCQMNVYDSHRITDVLRPLGYAPTDTPDDADMMMLNTCHIREKATDKVFSELGRLRDLKVERAANGKETIIAVAGCVAQAEGDVITARAPYVDMVFGPQTYHQLPEMVANLTGAYGQNRIINTDFPIDTKFDDLPNETGSQGVSAFLSIQEGCDKFCTFCVVPYTRGAEFSRPVLDVVGEAQRIADTGAIDLTLLGQNVNAYHGVGPNGDVWGLGQLLDELSKIDLIKRLRYFTSHPRDVRDDLINAHGQNPKVMPFLHLPVQSGSNKILAAMNRKHTVDEYKRIIEKFRALRPDIALSSDFIVGFPGETDQDHEDTIKFIEDVGFASAYSFKYSPRPGTPAANMGGLVREEIKTARLNEMQDLLFKKARLFNEAFLNQTVDVLFDRTGDNGQLIGKTPHNQSVHVTAPARLLGQMMPVKITGASASSLRGELKQFDDK